MITIQRNADHAKQARRLRGNICPCVVCGRPVPNPKWMIHVHEGGSSAVTEDEANALNESGHAGADLGGYPIGADCLRRHPELKPYAVRCDTK